MGIHTERLLPLYVEQTARKFVYTELVMNWTVCEHIDRNSNCLVLFLAYLHFKIVHIQFIAN